MADASRSPLAPVEALSFRNSLAAGAVLGLLVIGLAWGLGPMEVDHDAPHGPKDRISAAPKAGAAAEGGPAAAAVDGGGGGGADANDDDEDGGGGNGDGDDDEGIEDDGGGEDDEGIEDDGDDDDDGDEEPAEESDGDEPNDEGDAAGMDTTSGDEMVLEDDEDGDGDGDGGDGSRKNGAGAGSTPAGKPDPTADMTPEELYDEAKKAFDEKRYRDAYRLATRSYYKKKSDKTLLLKGKAACGMKDEKAAKNAMKSFGLSDDRRKTIRNFCRDRGVRVGL